MSQTQALAERIYALAKKLNRAPSTLSRELLGNGIRLEKLATGASMTLGVFERVEQRVSELERKVAA